MGVKRRRCKPKRSGTRTSIVYAHRLHLKVRAASVSEAVLPAGNIYVSDGYSPGLQQVSCDRFSPTWWSATRPPVRGPTCVPASHHWYVDRRLPGVGFLNRDEAHLLYNAAFSRRDNNQASSVALPDFHRLVSSVRLPGATGRLGIYTIF